MGGDWYDVIPIAAGRVGLVMGDVAGKGLAAASMVGRLRSALRAYALEGHDPPTVVARLNQLVWSEVGRLGDGDARLRGDRPGGEHRVVGERRPPAAAGGGRRRRGDLPGGAGVGAAGRDAVPLVQRGDARSCPPGATVLLYTDGLVERPGELLDDGPGAAVHGRDGARRAVPSASATGSCAAWCRPARRRTTWRVLALHSPPLGDRFRLQLPADAGAAGLDARAAAPLAAPRRARPTATLAEILTATGEAAANAIEHGSESPDGRSRSSGEATGGRGRADRARHAATGGPAAPTAAAAGW